MPVFGDKVGMGVANHDDVTRRPRSEPEKQTKRMAGIRGEGVMRWIEV